MNKLEKLMLHNRCSRFITEHNGLNDNLWKKWFDSQLTKTEYVKQYHSKDYERIVKSIKEETNKPRTLTF